MVYSEQFRLLNAALPRRHLLYRYGYAIDPDPVMCCPGLKPAARLVYRAILRLCGRGTTVKASVEQIAAQAGVSVRSVQRHTATLAVRDLIAVDEEPGARTIFRLLPLPAWIVEGRKPVLAENRAPETVEAGEGTGGGGSGTDYLRQDMGLTSHVSRLPSAPEGCHPVGEGVTSCRGRGDSLSPHENNKEHELENQNSLSRHGTQLCNEWTDQHQAAEREGVGEGVVFRLGEPEPQPDPTPQQIVRDTCQALGFRPTEAQVAFGVREVMALCADGFSLSEIGEGARYAAEQGWVRSFAGVKFYLPQALSMCKVEQTPCALPPVLSDAASMPCAMRPAPCDVLTEDRQHQALASPHRALWDQVGERIASRIQRQSYRTWFAPAYIADCDGHRVTLNVPSAFYGDWLEEHYLPIIEASLEEVLGQPVQISFQTPGDR